ncbi:helix-turn-helix transcriptional regulator [Ottowia oryzae]|uniref:Transcriptional regulator n=1 Tax=Ottowia oryzae TaxID=2109914 RepID=A0A2S0MD29_9BURK|nr:YafY family protein [Ottowia oryzae]AVO33730.1 transcriptional regulator [Ottowia oryzae]
MSRAARLLQLLEHLRAHRRPVLGADLARASGVSLRTLYRDIGTLREQGAQIEGDPGVGYVLRPGFTLPPLMFSEDELEALVLGARWVAAHAADGELAAAAQGVMNRITTTLPAELRLAVETSGLFVPARADAQPVAPWLPALRQAIRDEHALWLDYRDEADRATRRRVWPFAMAFFDHARLIAAWCELRQDFRSFRADRVVALEATGQRYPERRHVLLQRWRAGCLNVHPAGQAADRS